MTNPQYKAVLENFDSLVKTINATTGALKDLQRQFIMKEWLDMTEQPDADALTTKALGQIQLNSENYNVFIKMLSAVVGLQEVVSKIKSTYHMSTKIIAKAVSFFMALSENENYLALLWL